MTTVTLDVLYQELKALHRDVDFVKSILVPEETANPRELARLRRIQSEMKAGREKTWEQIFREKA